MVVTVLVVVAAVTGLVGILLIGVYGSLPMPQPGAPRPVPRCYHASVPWPVISAGDLVAWLCEDCLETRDTFTPPAPTPVKVESPPHEHEWVEVRVMDGSTVYSYCAECGAHRVEVREHEWGDHQWMVVSTWGDPILGGVRVECGVCRHRALFTHETARNLGVWYG